MSNDDGNTSYEDRFWSDYGNASPTMKSFTEEELLKSEEEGVESTTNRDKFAPYTFSKKLGNEGRKCFPAVSNENGIEDAIAEEEIRRHWTTMKDKDLVDYVNEVRNKAKLAKSL